MTFFYDNTKTKPAFYVSVLLIILWSIYEPFCSIHTRFNILCLIDYDQLCNTWRCCALFLRSYLLIHWIDFNKLFFKLKLLRFTGSVVIKIKRKFKAAPSVTQSTMSLFTWNDPVQIKKKMCLITGSVLKLSRYTFPLLEFVTIVVRVSDLTTT